MTDSTDPVTKQRYKLIVEFDGTDFSGWQRQANAERTVQALLEDSLARITQQKIVIMGSGRTDAGVHAEAQVAHVDMTDLKISVEKLHLALNSLLDKDVQILSFEPTDPNFHARFDAISRSYRYRIERRIHPLKRRATWTPRYEWDGQIVREAVALLPGRHSFKSFCLARPGEEGYFCTVSDARWEMDQDGVSFYITADRFLHKMVRGLVGALIDVARGFYTVEDFGKLLNEPERNGAVRVAPPQGLTLLKVTYPESNSG